MRDFGTKVDNTAPAASGILTAAEDNDRFNELKNAVITSGQTLDGPTGPDTNELMLAEAMTRYSSGGIFCQDTGSANAYILDLVGNFVAPKSLFRGLQVVWYPGNSCGGPSVVNAFGLGLKKLLRPDQNELSANDVFVNSLCEARYEPGADSGNGAFLISPWALHIAQATGSTGGGSSGVIPLSGEGVSVDTTYHVNLNYPGLTTLNTVADADLFSFFSISANHHRKTTWGNLKALLGISSTATGLVGFKVITTSGNYTPTSGARRALVFATGGGGGGIGGNGKYGSGGGAGATAVAMIDLTSLTTVAVTIGVKGLGAQVNGGTGSGAAANGGQTSFGSYAVAGGGVGAALTTNNVPRYTRQDPGPGGTASAGALRLVGGPGTPGVENSFPDNGGGTSGNGGNSFWAGGGCGTLANAPGYGAGGAGDRDAGNDGGAGVVVVLEFA